MIYDAASFKLPIQLETDLLVIGSGPGGLTSAMVCSERGLSTMVLEGGDLLAPEDMTQREEEMLPRLFQESGGRTTVDRSVKIHQGRGVGGSSLHNLNVCKRIPQEILGSWRAEYGLEHLPLERWSELYSTVENMLAVGPVPAEARNRHNRLLEEACAKLQWRGGGLLHNRTGCLGSGFCELGCRYNAKNNAFKVMLPRFLASGGRMVIHAVATRLVHARGQVRVVEAAAVDPVTQEVIGQFSISAKRVCVAASATGTPALLLRSEIPDLSHQTGRTLRIHPAVVAAGDFPEEVRAWEGVPQSYECTEFLQPEDPSKHRTWILPSFAHPIGTSTMVPGAGEAHRRMMRRYANLAVFTAMIHDDTCGEISPRSTTGVSISYWPNASDRQELAFGLWASAKLLFAAGATSVMVPTQSPTVLSSQHDIDSLKNFEVKPGDIDIVAVHPMSSVSMGDDPKRSPVRSDGRHHQIENLFVADGSLFPTSIGIPPQLSIYAMGLHVGQTIARER